MKQQKNRKLIFYLTCAALLLSMAFYSPRTNASSTLSTMSTSALVDHILDNDYGATVLLFSDPAIAYSCLRLDHEIFSELESRSDAATEVLQRYEEIMGDGDCETDFLTYKQLALLQTLLVQPVYQQQLASSTQKSNSRQSYYNLSDSCTISQIPYTLDHIELTLQGNPIGFYITDFSYSDAGYQTMEDKLVDTYPKLSPISSGSTHYNCHSYAWYSTSTSNPYWIRYIDYYATDPHHGSRTFDSAEVGDIVVYKNSDNQYTHSAIITEISTNFWGKRVITCRSKWGQSSVFEHDIEYVEKSYYAGLSEPDYIFLHRSTSHTYTRWVSYTTSNHTRQCKHCTATVTESHTVNSLGKCVCGYSGPGALNSILPEDDHCCGS